MRVFATGNGRKTDSVDAHSVALAALRAPNLRRVTADAELIALGLLADRRDELGRTRTQTVNRVHRLLMELVPGGAKKFLSAMQARACRRCLPKALRRSTVRCGDQPPQLHRFATRDRFASWSGTAPLDASSGDQQRHRLSRTGNRKINRVLHIMAVVQLRHHTAGRAYYDRRRLAGKTSMEAMRALKRRLSNVIYTRMLSDHDGRELAGPGGQSGATTDSSATSFNPHTDPSDKPRPGPTEQTNPDTPTTS